MIRQPVLYLSHSLTPARARLGGGFTLIASLAYPIWVAHALHGHSLSSVEGVILKVFLAVWLIILAGALQRAAYPGGMLTGKLGALPSVETVLSLAAVLAVDGSLLSLILYGVASVAAIYRPACQLIFRR